MSLGILECPLWYLLFDAFLSDLFVMIKQEL